MTPNRDSNYEGPDETGATTAYRLWQLEEEIKNEVRPVIATVALLRQSHVEFVEQQRKDNIEIKESMKSLRSTLVGFAFAVAGSAVVFAFAAFNLFSH